MDHAPCGFVVDLGDHETDAPACEGSMSGHDASVAARVLLVDDDALVRETLSDQLEMLGFAILQATCGAEALALLDGGASVDVLLSDLSMPGIDGIETIRQARQRRPSLPCTLLTGYAGTRLGAADTEAFQVLRKPIAGEALGAHLRARIAECRSVR